MMRTVFLFITISLPLPLYAELRQKFMWPSCNSTELPDAARERGEIKLTVENAKQIADQVFRENGLMKIGGIKSLDRSNRPASLWGGETYLVNCRTEIDFVRINSNSKPTDPAALKLEVSPHGHKDFLGFIGIMNLSVEYIQRHNPSFNNPFEINLERPQFQENSPSALFYARDVSGGLRVIRLMRAFEKEFGSYENALKEVGSLEGEIINRLSKYQIRKLVAQAVEKFSPQYSESGTPTRQPNPFNTKQKGWMEGDLQLYEDAIFDYSSAVQPQSSNPGLLGISDSRLGYYNPYRDPYVLRTFKSFGSEVPSERGQ